jgi:predicted amidohydrolase
MLKGVFNTEGRSMDRVIRIAGVQTKPRLLETERNLSECLDKIYLTASEGARLVVFPECALSGYVFSSLEEALPSAEPIPGPSTDQIIAACRELDVYVAIGLLEQDGEKYYNAAALLGPEGLIGKHRKAHLPELGLDQFVDRGDLPFAAYDTDVGKIGMAICWESCFPEHIRTLVLQGAEIIVLPTNWPDWPVVRVIRDLLVPARAAENGVFVIAVDRVGTEGDVTFLGGSRVAGMLGAVLVEVNDHQEGIMYADIDLAKTHEKMGLLSKRRPDLYGPVARI